MPEAPRPDAARAYARWCDVARDDALYDAVLAGDVDRVATERGFDAADRAVLDELAAAPDALRWNVGNLRYRASLETMLKFQRWLPLTVALLTDGRADWLIDLCAEYLARHRWEELGHRHFAECLRFADFVERDVACRRRLPEHLDTVLRYETAICRMLAGTADAHGDPSEGTGSLLTACPRPARSTTVIELAADIRAWIVEGRPAGAPGPDPLTMLAFVPPVGDTFWAIALDDAQRAIFEHCTGDASGGAIADASARDLGVSPADVLALLDAWVREGALTLV